MHSANSTGGKDLYPGVMGISLKQGDPFATPAELGATQAGSPSYKAGLRGGDTIVEIDSTPIERQSQLRHVLGPHYAGEKVHVVYIRGKDKERLEADIELTDKLIPYEHPFLGVLPLPSFGGGPAEAKRRGPAGAARDRGLEPETWDELVALMKAKPNEFQYASSGIGSTQHIAGIGFATVTGTSPVHVPYKGSAQAHADLITGRVQMMLDTTSSAMPQIKAGKLRPLAVTTPTRSAELPTDELPPAADPRTTSVIAGSRLDFLEALAGQPTRRDREAEKARKQKARRKRRAAGKCEKIEPEKL